MGGAVSCLAESFPEGGSSADDDAEQAAGEDDLEAELVQISGDAEEGEGESCGQPDARLVVGHAGVARAVDRLPDGGSEENEPKGEADRRAGHDVVLPRLGVLRLSRCAFVSAAVGSFEPVAELLGA